jgi:hypothetical protein
LCFGLDAIKVEAGRPIATIEVDVADKKPTNKYGMPDGHSSFIPALPCIRAKSHLEQPIVKCRAVNISCHFADK